MLIDRGHFPTTRHCLSEPIPSRQKPLSLAKRKLVQHKPGDAMPGNVEPVSAFTPAIVGILGRLASFQIADVARQDVRSLVRKAASVAALDFERERVVLVAGAVVYVGDRRVVGKATRLFDEQARIRKRLVDVKIGRASCRERVEMSAAGGSLRNRSGKW